MRSLTLASENRRAPRWRAEWAPVCSARVVARRPSPAPIDMSRAPRLIPGCAVSALRLTPEESFVLSCVDGAATAEDIAEILGVSAERVAATLARLEEVGAIERHGRSPTGQPRTRSTSVPRGDPEPPRARSTGPRDVAAASPDVEPVELDETRRQAIATLHARLDQVDYYELLGVPYDADKKSIKRAYYALAPDFHPDKFFRRQIGSYRPRVEAIFTRLSLALEVLTSPEKKSLYDAENGIAARRARMPRPAVVPADSSTPPPARTGPSSSAPPAVQPSVGSRPGRERVPTAPRSSEAGARRIAVDPLTEEERRQLLARKLSGRATTEPRPEPAEDGASGVRFAGDARTGMDALKARYEAAKHSADRQQVDAFVKRAREAAAVGDVVTASNALRIATSLAPLNEELQREAGEMAKRAAVELAATYAHQAEADAANNRWGEAALAFAKACEGRPGDAMLHDRAAFATLRAGGQPRRAVDFARRAVELAPNVPDHHLTLARAYFAAGLRMSGEGEIVRAVQLAPNDARIRDLAAKTRETAPSQGS